MADPARVHRPSSRFAVFACLLIAGGVLLAGCTLGDPSAQLPPVLTAEERAYWQAASPLWESAKKGLDPFANICQGPLLRGMDAADFRTCAADLDKLKAFIADYQARIAKLPPVPPLFRTWHGRLVQGFRQLGQAEADYRAWRGPCASLGTEIERQKAAGADTWEGTARYLKDCANGPPNQKSIARQAEAAFTFSAEIDAINQQLNARYDAAEKGKEPLLRIGTWSLLVPQGLRGWVYALLAAGLIFALAMFQGRRSKALRVAGLVALVFIPVGAAVTSIEGTEARLGERLVEEGDQVLFGQQTYFEVGSSSCLYAQPATSAPCRVALQAGSTVYAYARRGDWLRARTIKTFRSDEPEAIGWVPAASVRTSTKSLAATMKPILPEVYSTQDLVLDLVGVALGVAVARLVRRPGKWLAALISLPFLGLTLWHFITLFAEYAQAYRIQDADFASTFFLYYWSIACAVLLSNGIGDLLHALLAGETRYDVTASQARLVLAPLLAVLSCAGLVAGAFLARQRGLPLLTAPGPLAGQSLSPEDIFAMPATAWLLGMAALVAAGAGIVEAYRFRYRADRLNWLRPALYLTFPAVLSGVTFAILALVLGFALPAAALVAAAAGLLAAVWPALIGWRFLAYFVPGLALGV